MADTAGKSAQESGTLGLSVYNLMKLAFIRDPNAEFKVAGSCGVALLSYVDSLQADKTVHGGVEAWFGNCDHWGAAEWFERLANAVMEQDKAVVAGDELRMDTYRNIAASSAMELVRGYRTEVRAALRRLPGACPCCGGGGRACLDQPARKRAASESGRDREACSRHRQDHHTRRASA